MSERTTAKFGENWGALGQIVFDRTFRPLRHPTFVIYFFVAVAGIGAWGLWVELFNFAITEKGDIARFKGVFVNVIPAFAAPTCMQLLLAEKERALRAFSILLVAICAISLALCNGLPPIPSVVFGLLSILVAMWLWWITNANQSDFSDDRMNPDAATGGVPNPNAPMPGTLVGFKT